MRARLVHQSSIKVYRCCVAGYEPWWKLKYQHQRHARQVIHIHRGRSWRRLQRRYKCAMPEQRMQRESVRPFVEKMWLWSCVNRLLKFLNLRHRVMKNEKWTVKMRKETRGEHAKLFIRATMWPSLLEIRRRSTGRISDNLVFTHLPLYEYFSSLLLNTFIFYETKMSLKMVPGNKSSNVT